MSPLQFYRVLVILNGAVPLLMLGWDAYHGLLGANSVNNALHVTGILSLVFLFISLLMTPMRWITGWGGWIAFRRTLGLYGCYYSILHVAIYVGFDRAMNFSSTFHEIWMRRFLQIGTAAVFLMIPLAVTSTDSMIRIIGSQRWKLLHRLAYVVAVLGVVHYYLLVKSDVRQPLAFGGVLSVLLGSRFVRHYFELQCAAKKNAKSPLPAVSIASPISVSLSTLESGKAVRQWKGELTVAAIFQETHDVKTFRLMSTDGGSFPFTYMPGQYLNIQLMIEGKRVNRSYTIASSPTRTEACELSIKREPMGLASRFLHDQLKVGDLLKVSGPSGKFVFTGRDSSKVLLISGGVGITPLMSIIRYLTDRAWSGEIYFLMIARTEEDLIFYEEIQWLKARFPRLYVCTTLTRTDSSSTWAGNRGRATEAMLRDFVPDFEQLSVYLCGPNEMMDATRDLLLGMGVPDQQIKTEAFASKGARKPLTQVSPDVVISDPKWEDREDSSFSPEATNASSVITFSRSGTRVQVTSETTVLEAAEASSIVLPFECRSGICGQCKARLIEGTVRMECEDALSSLEKANGLILACQARPRTNLIVDA